MDISKETISAVLGKQEFQLKLKSFIMTNPLRIQVFVNTENYTASLHTIFSNVYEDKSKHLVFSTLIARSAGADFMAQEVFNIRDGNGKLIEENFEIWWKKRLNEDGELYTGINYKSEFEGVINVVIE